MKLAAKIGILLALLPVPALAQSAATRSPTVVELYQSQGCSSCPPAIANVNAIADRPDILALTFAVTYWDRLGWKDTFATREFTARQYDYAHGLHHPNVYTPQVVIDGRVDLTGTDQTELLRAVVRPAPHGEPALARSGAAVSVGAAQAAPADVWLVRYDPRVQNVVIGAGENSGVTIAHRNVVRGLIHLGDWTGAARNYPLPTGGDPTWRGAVLLQAKKGGPILAALKL